MAEPSSMCGFRSGSIQESTFDSGRINGILSWMKAIVVNTRGQEPQFLPSGAYGAPGERTF